jgi:hypothetical protein
MAMARGGVGKHLAGKVVRGKEGPFVHCGHGSGANVSLAQGNPAGCVREPDTGSFHLFEHQGLLGQIE